MRKEIIAEGLDKIDDAFLMEAAAEFAEDGEVSAWRLRRKKPRVRFGRGMIAACLAVLILAGSGVGAYVSEMSKLHAAEAFFDEYGLSREGLNSAEVKAVYRDISQNQFIYEKTAEVIQNAVFCCELPEDKLTPEELATLWDSTLGQKTKTHRYHTGNSPQSEIAESETKILFTVMGQLMYYDKANGDCRVFCFDPLCSHDVRSGCFSWKFRYLTLPSLEKIFYEEKSRRFYVVRGEKLYSFSENGTDLRLEFSLGDIGEWNDVYYSLVSSISYMERYDSFLYFYKKDSDDGRRTFCRYDMEKRELETLASGDNLQVMAWYFFDGKYLCFAALRDGGYDVYRANPDLSDPKKLDNVTVTLCDGVSDGVLMYYMETEWNDEEHKNVPIAISTYDVKNCQNKQILPFSDGEWRKLLFVTDEWLYFSIENHLYLGRYRKSGDVQTEYQTIYKIKKDGSSAPEKVFEEMTGSVFELFISGDIAMTKGSAWTIDGENASFRNYVRKATVDENGNFTDWEELS